MENKKSKEEKVEIFTDDMHKNMFVFQDPMRNFSSGKVVMKSLNLDSQRKKMKVR